MRRIRITPEGLYWLGLALLAVVKWLAAAIEEQVRVLGGPFGSLPLPLAFAQLSPDSVPE